MLSHEDPALQAGVDNLLVNCARLGRGDRLLILAEPPGLGYYDDALADTVALIARRRGMAVEIGTVPFDPAVTELCPTLAGRMEEADCTLFLARLGDQLRFRVAGNGRRIISYALDRAALGSGYGTAHHGAFLRLKLAIDAMLARADEIRVTCPLGTDLTGPGWSDAGAADTALLRFPMSVFTPVPAAGFSGTVAIAGLLVGTGARYYEPYGFALTGPLRARIERGRLTGFDGDPADVDRAERHYDAVARRFGIDRDAVHSWHAGIHPGCAHPRPAGEDYARWSGSAFGNPRLLHIHTCGDYAPGEICWNVVDPTIAIDGVPVWQDGRLHPERVTGGVAILAEHPCAAAVFAAPERAIGIDLEALLASAHTSGSARATA